MKKKILFGFAILIISSLLVFQVGCSGKKSNNKSSSDSKVTTESSQSSYDCPHCNGSGERINNVTGEYTTCSSCGGDGKVTKEQYDHLSK